jgi:uncharacterized protein (TIGR03437 family)
MTARAGRAPLLFLCFLTAVTAQPRRVLYVTHSAGYRHDSIPTSVETVRALDPDRLDVTATEDVSLLNAETLRTYDAVFFFTSGELPISDEQKAALLDFVRSGKGFGGAHSATDTLYTWPEYKNLIGATFDGHPWVQKVRIDVEDPGNAIVGHLAPGFAILDEIYQFRDFSRDRLRVLLSLDTTSADTAATGINRTDGDFALAWSQWYGSGRVFYTALGHFDSTWQDARFRDVLRNALLWMTGQIDAPAEPRPSVAPRLAADGIGNAADLEPRAISPGALFTVYGDGLTIGSTSATSEPVNKLAGTVVRVNGAAVPIWYASPHQINAAAPQALDAGTTARIEVVLPGEVVAVGSTAVLARTPGVFAASPNADGTVTIWSTGLGAVASSYDTIWRPTIEINGVRADLLSSRAVPESAGLYQIEARMPAGVAPPFDVRLVE